jgi:hypothetical protein
MTYDEDKENRKKLKNERVSDRFSVSPDGKWHAELKRAYFNPVSRDD